VEFDFYFYNSVSFTVARIL